MSSEMGGGQCEARGFDAQECTYRYLARPYLLDKLASLLFVSSGEQKVCSVGTGRSEMFIQTYLTIASNANTYIFVDIKFDVSFYNGSLSTSPQRQKV